MRLRFEATQLAVSSQVEQVVASETWECADLTEAREKAEGMLMAGLIPGIDQRPFAVRVLNHAGVVELRVSLTDIRL
jgi:hypothetical protein